MAEPFLEESIAVLERTPEVLTVLLRGLAEGWTHATEGLETWSPYDVMGHLIHGEQTDWMPRIEMILEHGTSRKFAPFDREAQFQIGDRPHLEALLDEFVALRRKTLAKLRQLDLKPEQLELEGMHPAFGPVTLRQLIATWTAHDLAHLVQVTRVMAKRYREEVGPWAAYLSVMR
jgi:hypothetical protein